MKKSKIKIIAAGTILFLAVFGFLYANPAILHADDDEGDEREHEEEEEENFQVINTDPEENEPQKTEYKTITTKLSDTVTQTTTTTIRHDTDKDGIYDDEDNHPTINDFFIVEDNDLNGIDDRYDK